MRNHLPMWCIPQHSHANSTTTFHVQASKMYARAVEIIHWRWGENSLHMRLWVIRNHKEASMYSVLLGFRYVYTLRVEVQVNQFLSRLKRFICWCIWYFSVVFIRVLAVMNRSLPLTFCWTLTFLHPTCSPLMQNEGFVNILSLSFSLSLFSLALSVPINIFCYHFSPGVVHSPVVSRRFPWWCFSDLHHWVSADSANLQFCCVGPHPYIASGG